MDVTPQLLNDVEFREAKRGGYNTQDVDEFLERLAVGLERQDSIVKEARQRIEAAEARVAEAERRAAEAERRAGEQSGSDETITRTLVLAQRTADAAIREAEEQAARTVGDAQDEAARLLSEAEDVAARARIEAEEDARHAHEEARSRVVAEMRELEGERDQLQFDVDLLHRHLEEQRERLRHSIGILQDLLDDPHQLGHQSPPEVSDVTAPAPSPRPPLVAPPLEPSLWTGGSDDDWTGDEAHEAEPEHDGPPTQAVDMAALADEDDPYLAELRKAITDEAPLGPREEDETSFGGSPEPVRSRFGRRR